MQIQTSRRTGRRPNPAFALVLSISLFAGFCVLLVVAPIFPSVQRRRSHLCGKIRWPLVFLLSPRTPMLIVGTTRQVGCASQTFCGLRAKNNNNYTNIWLITVKPNWTLLFKIGYSCKHICLKYHFSLVVFNITYYHYFLQYLASPKCHTKRVKAASLLISIAGCVLLVSDPWDM